MGGVGVGAAWWAAAFVCVHGRIARCSVGCLPSRDDRDRSVAFADGQKRESSVKKSVKFVVVCGAPLLAAGIALPSASADPTSTPSPNPTAANQPPGRYCVEEGGEMRCFKQTP
jgi:hypothetical protein